MKSQKGIIKKPAGPDIQTTTYNPPNLNNPSNIRTPKNSGGAPNVATTPKSYSQPNKNTPAVITTKDTMQNIFRKIKK